MSDTVSWVIQMSVRDGRLNDAKELVSESVEATRAEPGTLIYEYFLSEDGTSCHLYERYVDSSVAMQHVANFGASFGERFMECFEPTSFSAYGPVSDELRAALDRMGAAYLSRLGGFAR